MAIRTYKVTLDTRNSIAPEPVYLRQGDKTGAVVIDATLMDNGSPVSLSGLTPSFMANTADGKALISDTSGFNIVNAAGGKFTYQVPSQLGSVDGKIKIAYFSFSDSSGAQSTFNVVFVVEKAADITQKSAKDWVSNLNDIISQYNQWVNDAHSSWQEFVNANKEIIESVDPGGTLMNEVINARRPFGGDAYQTLGKRLDDMPSNVDLGKLVESVISVDGGVQDPFTSALDQFADTIPSSDNVATIGLIQDLHFLRPVIPIGSVTAAFGDAGPRGLVHIQHMGRLASKLDLVVYNGDTVDGREAKSATIKRIKQVINTQRLAMPDTPVIYTQGNHDDNGCWFNGAGKIENLLDLKEVQSAFEINRTYQYKDFESAKLRVIVLDAFENPEIYDADGVSKYLRNSASVFSAQQLQWLANVLLVPAGYAVLVIMHCPPLGYYGNLPYDVDYANYQDVNHNVMLGLLSAFQSGISVTLTGTNSDYQVTIDADYSKQGPGTLIGIAVGHEHRDAAPQTVNGITVIERTCNITTGDNRTIGDVSEDAFDVIEVDTTAKTCTFHRFGAGESLTINF